jgi:hypothetical protein
VESVVNNNLVKDKIKMAKEMFKMSAAPDVKGQKYIPN